jgi:hypothetical protein
MFSGPARGSRARGKHDACEDDGNSGGVKPGEGLAEQQDRKHRTECREQVDGEARGIRAHGSHAAIPAEERQHRRREPRYLISPRSQSEMAGM